MAAPRSTRGRIGVALTALGFIAMMLSIILGDRMPAVASLIAVLVFMAGILMMLIRGGNDAMSTADEPGAADEA